MPVVRTRVAHRLVHDELLDSDSRRLETILETRRPRVRKTPLGLLFSTLESTQNRKLGPTATEATQ